MQLYGNVSEGLCAVTTNVVRESNSVRPKYCELRPATDDDDQIQHRIRLERHEKLVYRYYAQYAGLTYIGIDIM
jgi:hypothetical protein